MVEYTYIGITISGHVCDSVQKISCESLNIFLAELGMVVLCHEPECHAETLGCYL